MFVSYSVYQDTIKAQPFASSRALLDARGPTAGGQSAGSYTSIVAELARGHFPAPIVQRVGRVLQLATQLVALLNQSYHPPIVR